MKRILINGTQPEELRVALVDGQKLYNLDIEIPSNEQKIASIYKGKITRIEPSLEAAFVDYGGNRHGFLPFKEIVPKYYKKDAPSDDKKLSIADCVQEGSEIILQIEKEERGNKGAAITTKISLAGRYCVLMPTEPRAGGVSRRIEGEDRRQVLATVKSVNQPKGMGCIVRTAGVGRSAEEIQWDMDYLATIWEAIERVADSRPAPFLIYEDSDLVVRAMRDHYSSDIGEIIIDDEGTYQRAHNFIAQVMPNTMRKLKHYTERTPLFNRFQIESQIESAFNREVQLPSGGAIVIDPTEALTSIDINSARATKGSDIEETALNTNLEAADEIARQLRLRDLGGLFVIDFIDMHANANQRAVEKRLREALSEDRARVQVGRISRFGLLEMSRQRLRPSLDESSQEICPRCSGHGSIRGVESLSLSILRLIEEEASKDKTGQVAAHLPVEVATYLLNEKRDHVANIQNRYNVNLILIPDENFKRPHYRIDRIRMDDRTHKTFQQQSYEQPEKAETPVPATHRAAASEVPAVRHVTPTNAAPLPITPNEPTKPGFFVKVWRSMFSTGAESSAAKPKKAAPKKTAQNQKKTGNKTGKPRQQGKNNRNNRSKQQNADKSQKSGNKQAQGRKRGPKNKNQPSKARQNNSAKSQNAKQGADNTEKANDNQKNDGGQNKQGNRGRKTQRGPGRRQQKNHQQKTQKNDSASQQQERSGDNQANDAKTSAGTPPAKQPVEKKNNNSGDSAPTNSAQDKNRPEPAKANESSAPKQPSNGSRQDAPKAERPANTAGNNAQTKSEPPTSPETVAKPAPAAKPEPKSVVHTIDD